MKPAFSLLLLLSIIACNQAEKKEPLSMEGAYKMTSVNMKSEKTDSTISDPHQLKIFTEDFMIYANVNPPDSISGFGIGTYSINGDTVTENVIYRAYDSTFNDTASAFNLVINKTDKGYTQVINDMGNNGEKFTLTENYESVGDSAVTPLDGAWKLAEHYYVKGNDTTKVQTTQYKVYYAGNCIWGTSWKDSLNKSHTAIGYGTFVMTGNNKLKESMKSSTFADVRGRDFDVDIEFTGNDKFRQSISTPEGGRNIEIYERLKK